MTQREQICRAFASLGIELVKEAASGDILSLRAESKPKGGYTAMWVQLHFHQDGSFDHYEFWE